jgi:predicted transposase YdaD
MTRARQKTIKIVLVINVLRKARMYREYVHEGAMSGSRASIERQIKNDVNFGEMKISGTFAAVIGFTKRFIVCE